MVTAKKLRNVSKDFGKRVRSLREKQGYSQEAFAHEVGVHRTYMGSIERGEKNVSLHNIAKIADALGLEIKDLL